MLYGSELRGRGLRVVKVVWRVTSTPFTTECLRILEGLRLGVGGGKVDVYSRTLPFLVGTRRFSPSAWGPTEVLWKSPSVSSLTEVLITLRNRREMTQRKHRYLPGSSHPRPSLSLAWMPVGQGVPGTVSFVFQSNRIRIETTPLF